MNHPRPTPHHTRPIRLMQRHWDWLEAQPRGVDASLRLLVELAMRDADGRYRATRIKEDCYLYMRDMAGDRPHFEEAVRALFANDKDALRHQMDAWPEAVRERVAELMQPIWANSLVQEHV